MRKNYRGNNGYVVRYGKYTPTTHEQEALVKKMKDIQDGY